MIPEFLRRYFIDPILHEEGYNAVNTTAYALLFVMMGFLCYRGLKRRNIKIDTAFLRAIAPYVLVGGVFRAMQDMNLPAQYLGDNFLQYLFVTPLIYFFVMVICVCSLFISLALMRESYWKATAGTAVVISLFGFLLLCLNARKVEYGALLLIPAGLVLSTAFMYYLAKRVSWDFITRNLWVVAGQMLDASATSFGLYSYGYVEQHVIPGYLISLTGTPFIFFPLKMLVVGLVLYILREEKDGELKNFILLLVFILGAAPGLRDFLRILFLT